MWAVIRAIIARGISGKLISTIEFGQRRPPSISLQVSTQHSPRADLRPICVDKHSMNIYTATPLDRADPGALQCAGCCSLQLLSRWRWQLRDSSGMANSRGNLDDWLLDE
jgi:hypothetical protein